MMKRQEIEAAAPGSTITDDKVPGLQLRTFASGRRVFYLAYTTTRKVRRKPKLGDYPHLSLTRAREIAQGMLDQVRAGGDPAAERRETRPTMAQLCDEYLERHAPKKKPASRREDEGKIRRTLRPRFGKMAVADVRLQDVEDMMAAMKGTPVEANRTLALLRKMMNLAERWEYRPLNSNPCKHVESYRERKRRRYLRAEEIPALARALDKLQEAHPQAVALFRCEILTGARGGELRAARWDELEPGRIVQADSKSGEQREIYLPASAEEAIRSLPKWSPWIFPKRDGKGPMAEPHKVWAKVRTAIGAPDLNMHDLRHSFASMRLAAGDDLAFIGRLLGHKSPLTTRRYAHLIEEAARASVEDHAAQWDAATKRGRSA